MALYRICAAFVFDDADTQDAGNKTCRRVCKMRLFFGLFASLIALAAVRAQNTFIEVSVANYISVEPVFNATLNRWVWRYPERTQCTRSNRTSDCGGYQAARGVNVVVPYHTTHVQPVFETAPGIGYPQDIQPAVFLSGAPLNANITSTRPALIPNSINAYRFVATMSYPASQDQPNVFVTGQLAALRRNHSVNNPTLIGARYTPQTTVYPFFVFNVTKSPQTLRLRDIRMNPSTLAGRVRQIFGTNTEIEGVPDFTNATGLRVGYEWRIPALLYQSMCLTFFPDDMFNLFMDVSYTSGASSTTPGYEGPVFDDRYGIEFPLNSPYCFAATTTNGVYNNVTIGVTINSAETTQSRSGPILRVTTIRTFPTVYTTLRSVRVLLNNILYTLGNTTRGLAMEVSIPAGLPTSFDLTVVDKIKSTLVLTWYIISVISISNIETTRGLENVALYYNTTQTLVIPPLIQGRTYNMFLTVWMSNALVSDPAELLRSSIPGVQPYTFNIVLIAVAPPTTTTTTTTTTPSTTTAAPTTTDSGTTVSGTTPPLTTTTTTRPVSLSSSSTGAAGNTTAPGSSSSSLSLWQMIAIGGGGVVGVILLGYIVSKMNSDKRAFDGVRARMAGSGEDRNKIDDGLTSGVFF